MSSSMTLRERQGRVSVIWLEGEGKGRVREGEGI